MLLINVFREGVSELVQTTMPLIIISGMAVISKQYLRTSKYMCLMFVELLVLCKLPRSISVSLVSSGFLACFHNHA